VRLGSRSAGPEFELELESELEAVAEFEPGSETSVDSGVGEDVRMAESSARIASRIDEAAKLPIPLMFNPSGSIIWLMRLAKFSDSVSAWCEGVCAAAAREEDTSVKDALPKALLAEVEDPRGAGGAVEPKSEGAMQVRDRDALCRGAVAMSGQAPPTSPPACSSPLRLGTMLAQSTLTRVLVALFDNSTHRRPFAWMAEPTTCVAIL